jgi:hypothetical protein
MDLFSVVGLEAAVNEERLNFRKTSLDGKTTFVGNTPLDG